MNLCEHLVTHSRLARRVREQSRVEERNQRLDDRLCAAVRQAPGYAAQHFGQLRGSFACQVTGARQDLDDRVDQSTREIDADPGPLALIDDRNCTLYDPC